MAGLFAITFIAQTVGHDSPSETRLVPIRPTHFSARQPASPRNLAHDVHLYCDTRGANLGRITSTVPAGDENDSRVTVTTTLGRFVLHSDGKIERGKLLKESLHGCYTSRRASE